MQDGLVITHPAIIVSDAEPLIVEAELPADVERGPVRICSADDCVEFEVIEP